MLPKLLAKYYQRNWCALAGTSIQLVTGGEETSREPESLRNGGTRVNKERKQYRGVECSWIISIYWRLIHTCLIGIFECLFGCSAQIEHIGANAIECFNCFFTTVRNELQGSVGEWS